MQTSPVSEFDLAVDIFEGARKLIPSEKTKPALLMHVPSVANTSIVFSVHVAFACYLLKGGRRLGR